MWGIEFFDKAAKNRRTLKQPSAQLATPKSKQVEKETSDQDESQETGTEESAVQSPPSQDSPQTGSDQASMYQIPQFSKPAVISEQAEPRLEMPNDETSEGKNSDHVAVKAAEHGGTSEGVEKRSHVTPNLRDESIDEDYVIIHHKEKGDMPKPGILWLFFKTYRQAKD